jgi:hypothetical protein
VGRRPRAFNLPAQEPVHFLPAQAEHENLTPDEPAFRMRMPEGHRLASSETALSKARGPSTRPHPYCWPSFAQPSVLGVSRHAAFAAPRDHENGGELA